MLTPAAGAALTPDTLAADFGKKTVHAERIVRALLAAVRGGRHTPVRRAFDEWKAAHGTPASAAVARELEWIDSSPGGARTPAILFALHTYYALIVKLAALRAVGRDYPRRDLRRSLARLERGVPFRDSGIRNFCEGNGGWYLAAWNQNLEEAVADLIQRLSEYRPPHTGGDFFKKLYLDLLPKTIRQEQGEYYTPDWLAERILTSTLESDLGDPSKRVLDPACGSGTFLVLLIRHIRLRVDDGRITRAQALRLTLRNVVGFDVNPLAVLTARANYLLALGDWLDAKRGAIEIPVYRADSALAPAKRFENACYYVVGNPPWVNWENLPEAGRRAAIPLWEHYGLFPKREKPLATILGGAKYDLSMLIVYAAADRYLRRRGKLGFVVPQTLFKSAGAGQGFRRFRLPDGKPLAPCVVEDFVERKPFGAANRTATLILRKGQPVRYPVEYRYWKRGAGESYAWHAKPIDAADATSSWITARPAALAAITRLLGPSVYRAREGVNTGGANAVFWVEVLGGGRAGVRIRNILQGARTLVPATRAVVEGELLYPLLRGQNVARWSGNPESSILLTHRPGMKLRAIPETEMSAAFPQAWSYLSRFESTLRGRAAFRRYFKDQAPFYSLFNIGDYTFAPWKVVWREQAWPFTAAVSGPMKDQVIVPDHKLMLVPVESEQEAHYLCAALNSLAVSAAVAAYAVSTQIDTHVLEHIAVPKFDGRSRIHQKLAHWSQSAHHAVRDPDPAGLARAEAGVNRWVARLWDLTEADLRQIREFLREVGLTGADSGA